MHPHRRCADGVVRQAIPRGADGHALRPCDDAACGFSPSAQCPCRSRRIDRPNKYYDRKNKYYDRKSYRSLRNFYRSTCSDEGCQGNHEVCGSRGGRGVRTVQQTVRYACHLMKRMDGGPCRSPFSELISFRFGPTDKFYARRMMSHVSLRQCLPSESSSMAYSRR